MWIYQAAPNDLFLTDIYSRNRKSSKADMYITKQLTLSLRWCLKKQRQKAPVFKGSNVELLLYAALSCMHPKQGRQSVGI